MTKPIISVALSTYNGARFLDEQLRSLVAQQRLPDELVVGDDCSRDDTAQVIVAFAAQAPFPVKFEVGAENSGFGRNFARTLLRCSGRYIFFCDQDDSWEPDKIARCLAILEASTTPAIVTHDAMLVDDTLRPSGLTLCRQLEASGKPNPSDMVYGCCMGFDAFFARFFTPDHHHSHDVWLAEIGRLLRTNVHIDAPLIRYRRHDANTTGSYEASLSRTNRARRFVWRVRDARRTDIRSEVAAYLEFTSDLVTAFERNASEIIERFGSPCFELALSTLTSRQADLDARAQVLARPRLVRPLHLVRLGLAGGYSRSSRLGMLRDLIA